MLQGCRECYTRMLRGRYEEVTRKLLPWNVAFRLYRSVCRDVRHTTVHVRLRSRADVLSLHHCDTPPDSRTAAAAAATDVALLQLASDNIHDAT